MNSDKLNALIRKKSNGSSELALQYHKMFFFEHVLMRLSKSKYKDNIILKGGVLLSSIIGNDMRTTKDIDATLYSEPLTIDNIRNIFEYILSIDISDGVNFKIESIKDIRLEDEYGGYRINVLGTFDKIKAYFFIEITTGDIITPRAIDYKYKSIFSDETIDILSYNVETIIAEKFESIISKNVTTTRSKDFYDLYKLINDKEINIDEETLIRAIKNTFNKRNTDLKNIDESFDIIKNSKILEERFIKYKFELPYVNITYKDTINAISKVVKICDDAFNS